MHSHLLSKKFQHIYISLDVNFNESLTNDVVSFEQLGPDLFPKFPLREDPFSEEYWVIEKEMRKDVLIVKLDVSSPLETKMVC